MTSSLDKIAEFDPASTNINSYLERLEQYFIAKGVPADTGERFISRATLISVIGFKAYDVLSHLCSPEAPSEKTYGDLATILKDHFAPKKLLIAERYRFHNCIQLERESVSTFATKLKYFASTCNFGTHLNETLRDRLVCGVRNGSRARSFTTRPPSRSISLSVFSMNAENNGIEVRVELNGIHLLMKLDTGAGVSIVSQETFNRHFKRTPLLTLRYPPAHLNRTPSPSLWLVPSPTQVPKSEYHSATPCIGTKGNHLVLPHPWHFFSGPRMSFFKVLSMLQPFKMTFWSRTRMMMNSIFRIWTLFSVA